MNALRTVLLVATSLTVSLHANLLKLLPTLGNCSIRFEKFCVHAAMLKNTYEKNVKAACPNRDQAVLSKLPDGRIVAAVTSDGQREKGTIAFINRDELTIVNTGGGGAIFTDLKGAMSATLKPSVYRGLLRREDDYLLLGTDGLFDGLSDEEVMALVQKGLAAGGDQDHSAVIARTLVAQARRNGSCNDITAVLLCLPQKTPSNA